MLDTLKIYNDLKEKLEPDAALKIAETLANVYTELQNTVTKTEFNELKEIVKDLAQAQKRTEKRIDELAQAQKRTEKRIDELAQAQKRTEEGLNRLTQEVRQLTAEHKETRRQLGGISMTIGYTLENEAYKALPKLLERDFGISLKQRLDRDYIRDKEGQEIEVNILGYAERNGEEILIVGESKSQLSKNDINKYIRKKLDRLTDIHKSLFPVLITHQISASDVKKYAQEKGIAIYKSSQF